MSTHSKFIRGGAAPVGLKKGEVYATVRAVSQASARLLPDNGPHARGNGPAMCLATAEGHERRAGFLREDGKHKEAREALAEAKRWRDHAIALKEQSGLTALRGNCGVGIPSVRISA